jgi:hypothetical protein
VGVRPADAERADAGTARPALHGLPLRQLGVDVEGAVLEVDAGVFRLEVEARRELPMFEREDGFNQPRDAGGGVEVPDVGLHRADTAEPLRPRPLAESLGQRLDLDRVAEHRPGPVGLDVGDRLRVDAAHGVRLGDDLGLAAHARRGVADLQRAVVVDGRALDDGVNHVAVGQRLGQPLEGDDADAVPFHRPLRPRVEGAAVPVGRVDAALLVGVAVPERHGDGDAAGERDVALEIEEALAGRVQGDERGRARGLDGEAGPLEVQLVRDVRGQVVCAVVDGGLEEADRLQQVAVRHEVEQ